MYKSVKLNQESIKILKFFKEQVLEDEGIKTTYSNIVNDICSNMVNLNIDWNFVRKTPSDFKLDNDSAEIVSIDFSTISQKNLKNFIIKDICKKLNLTKPHLNFILKILLRAYYLQYNNINIYIDNK